MKTIDPKWKLVECTVFRDGIEDADYSGFELQKHGITVCKFSKESLKELKEFFANFTITP